VERRQTREGRDCVRNSSAAEYESLVEILDIFQDKELMEALRKSESNVRAGRLTSLEELLQRKG
jgi:hypothetical protein